MLPMILVQVLLIPNFLVGVLSVSTELVPIEASQQKNSQSLVVSQHDNAVINRGSFSVVPTFIWPVPHNSIGDGFGVFRSATDSIHMGVDIFPGLGTPILSTNAGIVTVVGSTGSYGYHVEIFDGSQYTMLYAHMIAGSIPSDIYVGANVTTGQVIGKVGGTGRVTAVHLHFEIHVNGRAIDPMPVMRRLVTF